MTVSDLISELEQFDDNCKKYLVFRKEHKSVECDNV